MFWTDLSASTTSDTYETIREPSVQSNKAYIIPSKAADRTFARNKIHDHRWFVWASGNKTKRKLYLQRVGEESRFIGLPELESSTY